MTYQVPLSYSINVSLSAQPQGLSDFNTNAIAIFTNEPAGFLDKYKAYLTPAPAATDFGTNSVTYKMANALFKPVPNFRTGGGMLYIFPFDGINATYGSFITSDITANISNFQSLTNGALSITINGDTKLLTGLNFSGVNTINDIVKILQNKGLNITIKANEGAIEFISKQPGETSSITINRISEADVIDISSSTYLDAEKGNTTQGTNASGTTLAAAVQEAIQQVYFGGVLTTQITDNATRQANASAIQAMDCVYYDNLQSLEDIVTVGNAIKSAGLGKTRTLAYSEGDGKEAIATYCSIAKSVNYKGSNTAHTMNFKTLTGITGDTGLNDTYLLNANVNGVDIYGLTGGLSVVYSNDNNGYTDDIENQLWFKKALEVAGFNYLRQTNTKIPQTESGMTGLKNAYAQVCEQGIRNGIIGAGKWNGSIPFGDSEDFARNIEEKGYYIYSIPVALQSQTDREARKAPLIQIALKFSGAFHFSDVIVTVQR